jgi:hypothetical protein
VRLRPLIGVKNREGAGGMHATLALLLLLASLAPTASYSPGAFTVTNGSYACATAENGACVTDGSGSYQNNERCTIKANFRVVLHAVTFNTESCCDRCARDGCDPPLPPSM